MAKYSQLTPRSFKGLKLIDTNIKVRLPIVAPTEIRSRTANSPAARATAPVLAQYNITPTLITNDKLDRISDHTRRYLRLS